MAEKKYHRRLVRKDEPLEDLTSTGEGEVDEFNTGFATALALFYGHREQFRELANRMQEVGDLRINGASDHLYGIEYPENLDVELEAKIRVFVSDAFSVRLAIHLSREEAEALFDRCRDLLKEIDEKVFGLKVVVNYG